MELFIKDRLYIPAVLPKEGNFNQFNLKKKILSKIEISEKERQEVELKENKENNRIEWDTKKDIPLSVDFSSEEMEFLKESCEKISDQTLPDDMWSSISRLYDEIQKTHNQAE